MERRLKGWREGRTDGRKAEVMKRRKEWKRGQKDGWKSKGIEGGREETRRETGLRALRCM